MSSQDAKTAATANQGGLHCVYGKCQGAPHSSNPCHPGCSFRMTAFDPLDHLLRQLTAAPKEASTDVWPAQPLIEAVARAICDGEGNDPEMASEGMALWEFRASEAVKAIQAVRRYDLAQR